MKASTLTLFSVLALCFSVSAFAKPKPTIEGTVTMADNPTDMLQSDGGGPYSAGIGKFSNAISVDNEGRQLYLDFSDCVSAQCERPFLSGYEDFFNFTIASARNLLPGESLNILVYFYLGQPRAEVYWEVVGNGVLETGPTMTAYDMDGDGESDRWVVESPEDAVWELYKMGKKAQPVHVSDFLLPFTLTFEAE